MGRKKHTAEEIVAKLRQFDVLISQGRKVAEAIRSIEVTEVTYYRWRSEYGGLKGEPTPSSNPGASQRWGGKKRIACPPPQPSMPAIRQAILDHLSRPPAQR
ncbi:transposase, partial [Methylobacterium sp. E-005]|uniref:transposase n=1 Tax=Methylobacterium sp. E-005 TaxID=2836549 RepID=UPI001FB94F08